MRSALRAGAAVVLSALGCAAQAASGLQGDGRTQEPSTSAAPLAGAPRLATPAGSAGEAEEAEEGAAPADAPLEPLSSPSALVELPVPRHGPAVLSIPLGATSRRPVLVAAHGAGDRPEWQCALWRGIVKDRAFVLCPRGFPINPYVPPEETGVDHLAR